MTGKKVWLFRRKSAKPDSPNINPPSSNNAAPSSSRALPITPQANAHPAQGEISRVGSSLTSDSPSLAHAGEDNAAEIGSPSTPSAPSPEKLRDHAERAREAATPSAPSPEKLRDHAERAREAAEEYNKRIREATEGLNEESDVADLDAFFDKLSRLSDFIKKEKQDKKEKQIEKEKEKGKKKKTKKKKKGKEEENKLSEPKLALDSWLRSKHLMKLKEVLYEAISAAKDFASSGDTKKMVQHFLKDIGGGHVSNIVFIVVANAWERYEDMSKNDEACLSLLVRINKLAKTVIDLQEVLQSGPESKKRMEDDVKEAKELIIETCIACCTQFEAPKRSRYLWTRGCGEKLEKLEKQLQQMYERLPLQVGIATLKAVQQRRQHPERSEDAVGTKKSVQLRKPDYPEYPKDAVGIEDPLREVIEQLEMESDKKAVAVVVHGFGAMGKTTLANAVFAELYKKKTEGFKFSFVELFKDRETPPNIEESQKFIIRDLKGDEPDEIRSYRGGQKQIESMLEEHETFIYIDNVLLPADTREQGQDALTRLLPENMANAKKLRLLITTRDTDAARMTMCKGVEKKLYPIKSLPEPKAVELLKKKLHDNGNQLDASQIDGIVKICGGVPGLLEVLAGFINVGEGRAVQNYETLMKEAKEKDWKGDIGGKIEQFVFAYDKLEENLKDAFLDICFLFRGCGWKEVSDIVGETELKRLKQRALVTEDVKSMTARVHDVILEVGLTMTKGNRFRLTTATEIEEFLDIEDEDLQKIKGIWASDNKVPLRIPASKLDLMSGSLRVLKLGPLTDVQGKCEKKFKELVFFSAITSHLPFYVSKLKGFEKLRHLCYNPADLQNLSQMPPYLRHVDINLNSPDFQVSSSCIQRLKYLRVLRLSNAQFKCLPQELGDMGNGWEEVSISGCQSLEELSISGCQYLKKVSISTLKSLRVLRMDDCSGLTQLPKGLGSLTSLQELYLKGCKSLKELASELENLTSLQKLDLSCCESLKELPISLGKLRSLQELHLHHCNSLQALPPSLEELSLLRLLDLSNCYRIEDLPCGLEKLTSLVELELYCCGLSSIPEIIGMLKLNSIDLNSAPLKHLPDGFCDFSTLTELDLTNCDRLEELPRRFGEVTSLRKLTLACCHSLQKLPESFCQLKCLEHLDLSSCSTLKELCKDFKGLSSLRVLSLRCCFKLKKLTEDFQCLTSLKVLDVRSCFELEGKWIDNMLKMEELQILRIVGSYLLEERWEEIQAQQCNQSWSCAVHTKQGLSNGENLLKQVQSKFDSMLTNGEGKPLNISGLPLHTLLLVMFDGEQEFRPDFPLPLLEESIDDIQTHFEMVYFGNHWDQLPKKVADRILGHAPANEDAKALFQELLPLVSMFSSFDWYLTSSFQMTAEIVSGQKDDKYLSSWKVFRFKNDEVEDFVVTKCGRYVKLKQLAERPGGSPIALLTELFPRGEEEISLSFLKNKDGESTKVGVDELKGKTILLDIRPANICYAVPLQALVEMYVMEKENFGFEIITVPIMQDNSKWDVSVKFSSEFPWLVLQNPWKLTNATKYFLVGNLRPQWDEGWDSWYRNTMRIIKSDGAIAPYRNPGVLRMVNTWGTAAYPFTAEKEEELIQREKTQMEAMSHAMFLFQHLERGAEQLREATRQQKMICLCCCHQKEFTNSMKNVLTELSDIIYIIYIPDFGGGQRTNCTLTFGKWYSTSESSKMSAAEMPKMLWSSLSEYEAMRFWARIYSLKKIINFEDQFQLSEMLSRMTNENYSWMLIMDEDGNLITTEGKEIVELLSEKYSDDIVKELMQKLIEGSKNSWKETLFELQKMSYIDSEESEGDPEEFDSEYSEGELEEFDREDSEGDLEESDDVESQGNLSEELCSDDADRDSDDGDRGRRRLPGELGNT